MQFRSPLSNARGLGAARSGTHHWWMQRLTALALVPLCLWFVYSLLCVAGADFAQASAWLGSPWVAVTMSLFVIALFYHSALGVQVVIEDYVHGEFARMGSLVLSKFVHILLAAACLFAVLKTALAQ